jgi:hypothetical protein
MILGRRYMNSGLYDADSTTGSQTSLTLLKSWLYDCKETHPQCRITASSLPTRGIDVGRGQNPITPRVI